MTVIESAAVAVLGMESDTCTVKLLVPVPVGVPDMTPVEAFRESPVGSVPTVTVHDPYGGVPPAAVSVTE